RAGTTGGGAARRRARTRPPTQTARAARNGARDGRRDRRHRRSLGASRDARGRPAPSPATVATRACVLALLAASTDSSLTALGAPSRPLLARADRRLRGVRDHLSPPRSNEPQRPRPSAPALPSPLHTSDTTRATRRRRGLKHDRLSSGPSTGRTGRDHATQADRTNGRAPGL